MSVDYITVVRDEDQYARIIAARYTKTLVEFHAEYPDAAASYAEGVTLGHPRLVESERRKTAAYWLECRLEDLMEYVADLHGGVYNRYKGNVAIDFYGHELSCEVYVTRCKTPVVTERGGFDSDIVCATKTVHSAKRNGAPRLALLGMAAHLIGGGCK